MPTDRFGGMLRLVVLGERGPALRGLCWWSSIRDEADAGSVGNGNGRLQHPAAEVEVEEERDDVAEGEGDWAGGELRVAADEAEHEGNAETDDG